jgi:hypothetical protein
VRRRSFLKGAGVVTVVVVGGGVWRAYDQGVFSVGEGPAYEAWKNWRNTAPNAPLALHLSRVGASIKPQPFWGARQLLLSRWTHPPIATPKLFG